MLRVTIDVDAPVGQAIGIKEQLAMMAESFGDIRRVSVDELRPEQIKMDGKGW
uniref:Uncharacterized protein n=1 Tax=Dulem virus 33 TaxID=3145751 RepID=A0AAU8B5F2_9CAUD